MRHKLSVKFFHLVAVADHAKIIRRRYKADLGYSHRKEILTLTEVQGIVPPQRHGADVFSVLYRVDIKLVNELVAGINQLNLGLSGILVFAVDVAPFLTA